MPTRKELIEELGGEIERLSSAMEENSESFAHSSDHLSSTIELSIEGLGSRQIDAANITAKGLENAAETILVAAVVGGCFWLFGKAVEVSIERAREANKKIDLIKSIQALQSRYPSLSYNFIVERSYAKGASREERQNILNGLLGDGIVTTRTADKGETLSLDPRNPKVIAFWEEVGALKEEAAEEHRRLSSE